MNNVFTYKIWNALNEWFSFHKWKSLSLSLAFWHFFLIGGNSGGQGGDQDSNLERDGSQIRGDDKTKMMILIFLKSKSPAGASERCSPSSARPARSRQRESRCAVGRGQEAGDQVLVDGDYDCDDDCIGWDVRSGYLVHWNFTVDVQRKHRFLSQGNADRPDNWGDGAAGLFQNQILNICTVLKIIAMSKHGHKQQYHQLHDAHNMSTSTSQRAEECGRQLLVSIPRSDFQTQFLLEVTSQGWDPVLSNVYPGYLKLWTIDDFFQVKTRELGQAQDRWGWKYDLFFCFVCFCSFLCWWIICQQYQIVTFFTQTHGFPF